MDAKTEVQKPEIALHSRRRKLQGLSYIRLITFKMLDYFQRSSSWYECLVNMIPYKKKN